MTDVRSATTMARRLQLPLANSNSSSLAAWTALIFASVTALVVWGVANAYPTL